MFFYINRKIKNLKRYMNEKEQLVDSMLSNLKKLDDTITDINEKVESSVETLDKLKSSYESKIADLNRHIDLNNEKRDVKVCVILHLYYIDLWDEFRSLLSNIHYNTDIYINLVDESMYRLNLVNFKNRVENEHKNCKVFINDNVGLDIGGSLLIFDYILKEEKEYDYILKLHSKKSIHGGRINSTKGEEWRNELLYPILGSYKIVNNIIDLFTENPIIGMIGAKKWLYDKHNNIYHDSNMLNEYIKKFNLKTTMDEIEYIGGTMFWVRFDIFKDFFTKNDITRIIRTFERNSFTDNKKLKWTHAFERVFGMIVTEYDKKIIGV